MFDMGYPLYKELSCKEDAPFQTINAHEQQCPYSIICIYNLRVSRRFPYWSLNYTYLAVNVSEYDEFRTK